MTDITTSPPTPLVGRTIFGWRLPKLGFLALISGAFVSIGTAFQLAYVAPYAATSRQRFVHDEVEAEDRNPDW